MSSPWREPDVIVEEKEGIVRLRFKALENMVIRKGQWSEIRIPVEVFPHFVRHLNVILENLRRKGRVP